MRFKKLIPCILFSLIIIFLIFYRGIDLKTDNKTLDVDAKGNTNVPVNGLMPYEINWYTLGDVQPNDTKEVEAEINKILKPKINATLKINMISSSDWSTKIGAAIAASDYMDIIFTAKWWYYNDYISKDAFIPLDKLVNDFAPNAKNAISEMDLNSVRFNGVLYALPTVKETAAYGGFLFNKKFIEKYNWEINSINKIEDIEPWLKVIRDNEPDIVPLALSDGENYNYLSPLRQITGSNDVPCAMYYDNRDTKVYNEFDTPEYRNYMKLARKFYLAGYISKDAAFKGNSNNNKKLLKNGKCFAAPAPLKPGKDVELSNDKVTWVQKQITDIYSEGATGSMQAISKTSKDPQRCMMFLDMLYTDKKLINLLAWGIEGKHYNFVTDNTIDVIPDNGWNWNLQWSFGNQFLNYLKKEEDPQKWEKFKEMNNKAKMPNSVGFFFDKEPIQAECAAIASATNTYYAPLMVGAIDPDEYLRRMLQSQKEAGIDKVINLIQKSFDDWYGKHRKR